MDKKVWEKIIQDIEEFGKKERANPIDLRAQLDELRAAKGAVEQLYKIRQKARADERSKIRELVEREAYYMTSEGYSAAEVAALKRA